MIELRTLGEFQVRKDGPSGPEPVALSAKRAALLIHLALGRPPGRHGRDTLLALFWPEASADRARHALSQAIYVLRKELGAGVIRGSGDDWLELDRGQLRCDAAEFEAALEAGKRELALELYAGDLLPGFFVSGCPEFEQWLELERARMRELAVAAARALAERERAAGNVALALRWLGAAAERAPFDEEIQTLLVTALRDLGDRTGAVRQYEAYAARLAATLDLSPSPMLAGLAESIRAGVGDPPSSASEPLRVSPAPTDAPTAAPLATASLSLAPEAADPAPPHAREPRRTSRTLGLAALVVAMVLASGLASRHWIGAAVQPVTAVAADPAPSPNRVLVLPFTDQRGEDDVLGRVAADWITQGLARSGLMEVVSPLRGPGIGTTAHPELPSPGIVGVDAAAETVVAGAAIVVTGSYYYLDPDRILFQARIQDVMSGRVLHALDPVTGSAEAPLEAVEKLRQRVTGALAALLDPRLAPWAAASGSPPSLEAYTLYVQGIERYTGAPIGAMDVGDIPAEAAAYFRRAFELDTTFTAALIWELMTNGWFMGGSGNLDGVAQLERLQARREGLPPWEQHMVEYILADHRMDWEAAYRAMRRVNELMPQSEWAWHLAVMALWTGRPAVTVAALDRVDPERSWWMRNWPLYCGFLLPALHSLGEHERELSEVARCRSLYPDYPGITHYEAHALSALGRGEEAAERALAALAAPAPPRFTARWIRGTLVILSRYGHEEATRRVADHAMDWYERDLSAAERHEVGPTDWGELLVAAHEYRRAREVLRPVADAADSPADQLRPLALLAIAEARMGNREDAFRLWEQMDRLELLPREAGRRAFYRARLAALLMEPEQAVRLLAEAWTRSGHPRIVGSVNYESEFDSLRDHPGFHAVIRPRD